MGGDFEEVLNPERRREVDEDSVKEEKLNMAEVILKEKAKVN